MKFYYVTNIFDLHTFDKSTGFKNGNRFFQIPTKKSKHELFFENSEVFFLSETLFSRT